MSVQVGRTRNRRGEGGLLRDEIVAAAERLLEREGDEDAITLRSVAREAGISAPSIYAHFADREAILDAVLDLAFDRLHSLATETVSAVPGDDPVSVLLAGCHAYADFAQREPARYRVLFARRRAARVDPARPADPAESTVGQRELTAQGALWSSSCAACTSSTIRASTCGSAAGGTPWPRLNT